MMRYDGCWLVWVGVLSALALGCSGGNGLPLVPVTGRVTIDGGPPPAKGQMLFNLIPGTGVAGQPYRSGRATFDTDGKFAATSFQEGDGLLPGKYRVFILCTDGEAGPGRPYDQISYVPADYQPEEIVVPADQGAVEHDFAVPRNPNKKNI